MAPLSKCVGYDWLLHERNLRPLIWKSSVFLVKSDYVARKLNAQAKSEGQVGVQCIYNKRLFADYDYLNVIDNLEAAFRYEPLDLYLIALTVKSFTHDDIEELENRLARLSSPSLRKIGYYYETMTGNKLHIKPISKRLNIAELIDSSRYFTSAVKSDMTDLEIKWRIRDNTLGKLGVYTPVISRNASLDVPPNAMSSYIGLLNQFPISIRDNVIDGLYAADSIASFEIEGEPLSAEDVRFKRFVKALRQISKEPLKFNSSELSKLQRICVDSKDKAAHGYRTIQNAIGGRPGSPAYMCPPPAEVDRMMQAVSRIHENIGNLPPVVAAAAVSGAFVLIHPFADGNGRISRLLISDALSRGYQDTPLIPICLGIKEHREEYISTLAKLTGPIMKRTNFTIEDNHYKLVDTDTDMFRYPDLTGYAEFLSKALLDTLEVQIPKEAEKTRLTLYLSAVFQEQGLRKINKKDRELIIASIVNNRGRLSNGLEEKLLKRNVCTEEQIDILRSSLTEREKPDTDPEMFTER